MKVASKVIDCHLCNIINKDLKSKYSEEAKTALVRPIYAKNEINKTERYRPVSILNGMCKIYERLIHTSLSFYAYCLSSVEFILTYRKSYCSNHVLLRPIENWKKSSDD